jgi:hypothetical protein
VRHADRTPARYNRSDVARASIIAGDSVRTRSSMV